MTSIRWIVGKAGEFQKNICFIDYAKAFDYVDHNKMENFLEMGIPDHLTCLWRNLYAGQEATVRTGSTLGKEYVKIVYYCQIYHLDPLKI